MLTHDSDDMKDMFKESVDGTLDLIEQQIAQVESKRLRVQVGITWRIVSHRVAKQDRQSIQTIFLSGGFSESKYLFRKVQKLCTGRSFKLFHGPDRHFTRYPSVSRFTRTNHTHSWTAVAKGGTLMGLQLGCELPPLCHKCPVHVGALLSERFKEYAHLSEQRYTDTFDDELRAKDNIKWFISKGDLIAPDEPIKKRLRLVTKMSQAGHRPGSLTIVTSTDSDPNGPATQLSKCSTYYLQAAEFQGMCANPSAREPSGEVGRV